MDLTNIGAYIKPVGTILPIGSAAGTLTGVAVDTQGYRSLTLAAALGAASGSPSAVAAVVSLNQSADGATNWTAVSGASVTISAVSSGGRVNVDLSTVQRYVQGQIVLTFTGGTSPAMPVHATVVLGGAYNLPTP